MTTAIDIRENPMNRTLIAFGTAAVLTAGMTGVTFAADRYASPSQPVPYSQLNAYMKGSASKRAAIVSQNTDASTAGVNTSATMPAPTNDTPAPAAAMPAAATPAPVNSGATTPAPNSATPAPAAATGPVPMPTAPNPPATPATPAAPQ